MSQDIEGRVISGINGIFAVETVRGELRCSIKGKRLGLDGRFHNPITVGDRVLVRTGRESSSPDQGSIVSLLARETFLARWNKHTRAPQMLAANCRTLACITSAASPPFRPRFLDRLIIAAEAGGMRPLIVLNKADLGVPPEVEDRLATYEELGYALVVCSALNGRGLDTLERSLAEGITVLAGQSGTGKSSILNRLDPVLKLRTGDVSAKHDRGVHTTTASQLYRLAGGLEVVDTPGMRELELTAIEAPELRHYFRDFAAAAERCEYDGCLHVDEERCGVREAAASGEVHPDRYESYLRTYEQLCEAARQRHE